MAQHSYAGLSTGGVGFVEKHALWDDTQRAAAEKLLTEIGQVDHVRVAFGDPHGLVRSKTLSAQAFRTVLRNGMDFSPGPFVFDTGHALPVDVFADGGQLGVPELKGAGDFILVPDPVTYRVLPHTSGRVGWVLGDEYLRDGTPHPLSSRGTLRRQLSRAEAKGLDYVVGLEVEWYLTRYADGGRVRAVGGFGVQGEPPLVEPVNGGYQFNADWLCDGLEPVLEPLCQALTRLGLPLRTVEHESGPGQLEFTFEPMDALAAADGMLMFRTITKQVCARLGHHASFMALPGLPGMDPSGWHLHQSLAAREDGTNLFTSADGEHTLSELGRGFVAGLLGRAAEASLLCVPTVNGYRRTRQAYSLSPDRAGWALENRGAFVRVLGAPGEPATHVENRVGEPSANPYLYLTAQLAAGLDGIERGLSLGPAVADPHGSGAVPLPASLGEALAAFEGNAFYRDVLGAELASCLSRLKRSELRRFEEWLAKAGPVDPAEVTAWEHKEYFTDF